MSSSFPLPLNPPVSLHHPKAHNLSRLPFFKPSFALSFPKSNVCFSSSIPNPSSSDREDVLWLREEQRWLREEQRSLREEQRWLRERDSLLNEIQSLKLRIQALEKQISVQDVDLVPETIPNVRALLQVLTEKIRISESGSSASPIVLEEKVEEDVKEVISVQESKEKKTRTTLRKGSEGKDVREMQEALQKLGFYSGEEDRVFQLLKWDRACSEDLATLGAPEDGIMTAQLLERLYMEQRIKSTRSNISVEQRGTLAVSQKI